MDETNHPNTSQFCTYQVGSLIHNLILLFIGKLHLVDYRIALHLYFPNATARYFGVPPLSYNFFSLEVFRLRQPLLTIFKMSRRSTSSRVEVDVLVCGMGPVSHLFEDSIEVANYHLDWSRCCQKAQPTCMGAGSWSMIFS